MKNVHIQFKSTEEDKEAGTASVTHGQAYVLAEDFKEAEAKLIKFLGKKAKVELTAFADANAEVIG